MVSIFILVFAVTALVRFAISQWRAIWISAANQQLSDSLQLTAGIDGATIGAGDFSTLLQLCNEVSPDLKKASPWLREVSVYYRAMTAFEQSFRVKVPSISSWAKGEMQICSRYAAVVLDQSLSMNMERRLAARANGCATYKWKLSRPAFLPVVFKLAIQMAAAESQDGVGSSNGPEHS